MVSYLGYRAYASDSINQSKAYFRRLRAALQKYVDALAAGGEICSSLARDLQTFLESEGDQVPNSVRQLAKLLQSPEVAATTTSTVTAVYRGISGIVNFGVASISTSTCVFSHGGQSFLPPPLPLCSLSLQQRFLNHIHQNHYTNNRTIIIITTPQRPTTTTSIRQNFRCPSQRQRSQPRFCGRLNGRKKHSCIILRNHTTARPAASSSTKPIRRRSPYNTRTRPRYNR